MIEDKLRPKVLELAINDFIDDLNFYISFLEYQKPFQKQIYEFFKSEVSQWEYLPKEKNMM